MFLTLDALSQLYTELTNKTNRYQKLPLLMINEPAEGEDEEMKYLGQKTARQRASRQQHGD